MGLAIEDILDLERSGDADLGEWLRANGRPQVEMVRYESDGWEIEAVLVLPGERRTELLPTLAYLHGGPERKNSPTIEDLASARGESAAIFLASHGYAVFLPNFRGSSGYGEQFMNELQDYQMMRTPFRDVIAGVDMLIDQGIADADRLGIYGSSYGAQLAAWATAYTERFKAAVLSVGRYDALVLDRCSGRAFHSLRPSRQGNSDPLDMWLKPEVYSDISPMHHIGSIRTPAMLVETGAERKDLQARMMFNALQAFGIESHWVYYPKAFHNGRWTDFYKRDYMTRLLAWWSHHLCGKDLPSLFKDKAVTVEADETISLDENG